MMLEWEEGLLEMGLLGMDLGERVIDQVPECTKEAGPELFQWFI